LTGLFNLRGTDIAFNPVFFAYAIVTLQGASLFVDSSKVSDKVYEHLGASVKVEAYDAFFPALSSLSGPGKVLIGKSASLAVAETVGWDQVEIVRSPVKDGQAVKNSVEIEGFRQSHRRDGAALVRTTDRALSTGRRCQLTLSR
jgi:Xaa-Pro aminopeptidase